MKNLRGVVYKSENDEGDSYSDESDNISDGSINDNNNSPKQSYIQIPYNCSIRFPLLTRLPGQESTYLEVNVPDDGTCLFYSVAFSVLLPALADRFQFTKIFITLFGEAALAEEEQFYNLLKTYDGDKFFIEKHANALEALIDVNFRQQLVNYIRQNNDEFDPFTSNEEPLEAWLAKLIKPKEEGNNCEIEAMSRLLGKRIIVYQQHAGQLIPCYQTKYDCTEVIYLYYTAANNLSKRDHYHYFININYLKPIICNESLMVFTRTQDECELVDWQPPTLDKAKIPINQFILNLVKKLHDANLDFTYAHKIALEQLACLPYEIQLEESTKICLLDVLMRILEEKKDKKFKWRNEITYAEYSLNWSRWSADLYSFHYYALQVIEKLVVIIIKNDLLKNILVLMRKVFRNSNDQEIKKSALSVIGKVGKNIIIEEKDKIISFLLDLIYLDKDESLERKAAFSLMEVIATGITENKRKKILLHLILLFRHSYSTHKTILYGLSTLWDLLSSEHRDNFIQFILSFLPHKNHNIRQGIARVFLELKIDNISRDNLQLIARELQKKLKRYELDNNASRFAIESLHKLYSCENADDELKREITKGLIARAKKEKNITNRVEILHNLNQFPWLDVLANDDKSAKRVIRQLIKFSQTKATGFDYEAIKLLEVIVNDKRFAAFSNEAFHCVNTYRSFCPKIVLVGRASPQQMDYEQKEEEINSIEDKVKEVDTVTDYNEQLAQENEKEHGINFKDFNYIEPEVNISFELAKDILYNEYSSEQLNEKLNDLLSILNDHVDEWERKEAVEELLVVYDELGLGYRLQIFQALHSTMFDDPDEEVRDYTATSIIRIKDLILIKDLLHGLIKLYLTDASKKVKNSAQESIRKILSDLLQFSKIDITPEVISALNNLPLNKKHIKGKHIEIIEQTISFCVALLSCREITIATKQEVFSILINIASRSDDFFVQHRIIYGLKSINNFSSEQFLQQSIETIIGNVKKTNLSLARAHALAENFRPAINSYKKVLVGDPNNAIVWFELGLTYFFAKDIQLAYEAMTSALDNSKKFYLAYLYRSQILMAMKSYDEAIADLDKAIKINHDCSLSYYYRALVREAQDYLDFAIDDLSEAIQIHPYFINAIEKKAELHYVEGDLRIAHETENLIKDFIPHYKGVTRKRKEALVKSWRDSSLKFCPKVNEINAIYKWLSSNIDEELDKLFDELIIKLNNIFGERQIEDCIRATDFSFCVLKSFEHANEKRIYVDDFIEFVVAKEIWEEYQQEYDFFINKSQRQVNLHHLLQESKIQDIFTEVGIKECEDNDKLLELLKSNCLGVYSILDFLHTYLGSNKLENGFALGITNNLKSSYDIFTKILGLCRWEAAYGKEWIYDTKSNDEDKEVGYGKFKIYGSNHHTDCFFNYVTNTNKPIVFFIPTDIGNFDNKNSVTYGEIAWLGQALQSDTHKLKNVILVFDAYNYLPLYILNKKRNRERLTVEVNISLEAIKEYLIDYGIVDEKRRGQFEKYTSANIQNHINRNLRYGILAELILAVHYNSLNPKKNSPGLLNFLNNTRSIINSYFDKKITFLALLSYIKNIIDFTNLNEQNILFKVAMIKFAKSAFADLEYRELFIHERGYNEQLSLMIVQIAQAFDFRSVALLQAQDFLEDIVDCYLELVNVNQFSVKLIPLEQIILIIGHLSNEDQRAIVMELFLNSSAQVDISNKAYIIIFEYYSRMKSIPEFILKSLAQVVSQPEIKSILFKEWLPLTECLTKILISIKDEDENEYKLQIFSLFTLLIQNQYIYLDRTTFIKYILLLLQIFSLAFSDIDCQDELDQIKNNVIQILSQLDKSIINELLNISLLDKNYQQIYDLLYNIKNIDYFDNQLINNLVENLYSDYNTGVDFPSVHEKIVKLLLSKFHSQLACSESHSHSLLSIFFIGMVNDKFKSDATALNRGKNAFIMALAKNFPVDMLNNIISSLEGKVLNKSEKTTLIITKLNDFLNEQKSVSSSNSITIISSVNDAQQLLTPTTHSNFHADKPINESRPSTSSLISSKPSQSEKMASRMSSSFFQRTATASTSQNSASANSTSSAAAALSNTPKKQLIANQDNYNDRALQNAEKYSKHEVRKFSSKSLALSDPQILTEKLLIRIRKGLKNETELTKVLQQYIPENLSLGKAHDKGDCFFDALAQCLNRINSTDINTDKYLRMLCHDYYEKNKAWVDQLNLKDYGGIDKHDDYSMVQYTVEEYEKRFYGRSPIWGRPYVEGIMLCNQLNLRGLSVIEILEHPETKQPITSFHWVNQESYTNIDEREAKERLSNLETPTLVVEQNSLHFVPLLSSNLNPVTSSKIVTPKNSEQSLEKQTNKAVNQPFKQGLAQNLASVLSFPPTSERHSDEFKKELGQSQAKTCHPSESKFSAQLDGQPIHFIRERIKGDGNCGLTGLGTSRQSFVETLLSLSNDEEARNTLYEEIYEALTSKDILPPSEKWQKLFDNKAKAQLVLDESIRELRQEMPEARQFEGEQFGELIARVSNQTSKQAKRWVEKLKLQQAMVSQIDEEIKDYCCDELMFKYYINSFLSDSKRLWVSHASALLFAKAENITIYIWETESKDSPQLKLKNKHISESPKNTIHLFYTGGSTHFDLLVENTQTKNLSSRPSLPSAAILFSLSHTPTIFKPSPEPVVKKSDDKNKNDEDDNILLDFLDCGK